MGRRALNQGSCLFRLYLSMNYNCILSKSFIKKQKLQHYPREPKVNIYVFHIC